jgi:hypothetical protein
MCRALALKEEWIIMAKANRRTEVGIPILKDGVMITAGSALEQKKRMYCCFKAYKGL